MAGTTDDSVRQAHAAYWDAEFADALYSKLIRALFGEKVTRWTINPDQKHHPEVRDAYRMMLDTHERYIAICQAGGTR